MKQENTYIYGTHAVEEALTRMPQTLRHLYFVSGHEHGNLLARTKELGIPFDHCDESHLPRGADHDVVHQGVLALITPSKILVPYKRFIQGLEVTPHTGLILLDELVDPQNVGAVIRSAAAFGLDGVLIPEHRQAQITGSVVKVSAGMAFAVPLVQVVNVNTVLRDLKERGFWVYGLVGGGSTHLQKEVFTKPSVFVVGNEGRGMREKTETLCDFRLSIPIEKKCESLNAAASAAVALYAWRTQR
jgi:23S rRNA (guanosine2251-2'-O)-methyltransferase